MKRKGQFRKLPLESSYSGDRRSQFEPLRRKQIGMELDR